MLFDQETLEGIARQVRMHKHPLITIDGPCDEGMFEIGRAHV